MIETILLHIVYLFFYSLIVETIIVFALIIFIIYLSKQTKKKKHICKQLQAFQCVSTFKPGKPLCGFSISYFYFTMKICRCQSNQLINHLFCLVKLLSSPLATLQLVSVLPFVFYGAHCAPLHIFLVMFCHGDVFLDTHLNPSHYPNLSWGRSF